MFICKKMDSYPAFYRDVNFQNAEAGQISHNDLTDLYCKLIKIR